MRIQANPASWQPFTPGGVAGLAIAGPGRLFRAQLVVAATVASALVWFLASAWFPVIDEATNHLPDHAVMRGRTLEWSGPVPVRLAGNRFFSVTVDPAGTWRPDNTTDLAIELGQEQLRIRSLLGYTAWPYPSGYRIGLSRMDAQAWWGAWRHPILAIILVISVVGQFLGWSLLALIYVTPIWLFGFYADRVGSFHVSWRLACAALLPGSVVLAGVIVLYGLQRIDLVGLLFGGALHLVVGWGYMLIAPFHLPRRPGNTKVPGGNPFRR
jgi:hypothetical protein